MTEKDLAKILLSEDIARHKVKQFLMKLYPSSELAVMWLEQDKGGNRKLIDSSVVDEITSEYNLIVSNDLAHLLRICIN